jgi:curved DNA-binding protein CbpA
MAAPPISIKLRCASWKQLAAIYERDLARGAVFLKSAAPPPVGTRVRINLTLPTQTLIVLNGSVDRHVGVGELNDRGPGVDIKLHNVPQSALWLIESTLESASRKGATAPATPASQAQGAAPSEELVDMELGAGEELVEAEGDLITALSQELASLGKLNPFQILGVGYETGDDEVRAAFGSLTKRYHPDRFARYESGEARRIAADIFILIRNAYHTLATGDERARALEALGKKPAAAPARQPPAPGQAADRSHGQDDLDAAYGRLDAGDLEEALRLFQRAGHRDPGDRAACIGLELARGLEALRDRDRLEAAQRFEAVLELDPTNERAARELAEMRGQAASERKSSLPGLRNQKE